MVNKEIVSFNPYHLLFGASGGGATNSHPVPFLWYLPYLHVLWDLKRPPSQSIVTNVPLFHCSLFKCAILHEMAEYHFCENLRWIQFLIYHNNIW